MKARDLFDMLKRLLRHPLPILFAVVFAAAAVSSVSYFIPRKIPPIRLASTALAVPVLSTSLPVPQLREIVDRFKPNQTITSALVGHGLSVQEVHDMVEAARMVYNLAKVRVQQPYWLYLTPEGQFHDFRYPVDENKFLTIYRDPDKRFVPVMKPFPYETRVEPVSGVIEDSLFMSMIDSGEQERLALDLADIFGSDIDFYTDIQRGDSYRLLVEKKYLNGDFKLYGNILAASITNQNKQFSGFRFVDENGRPAYYGPDGKALKKSFLKSPLKFARISSGFSRARMHPILKIVRPHLGVDYAAPVGTPVQAVGAGTVVAAGLNGGGGKTVKLRHAGSYETMYMHLSRIAVRLGTRVAQGDLIGYVGATGLATGPHLDFRIWLHGKPVNPAKVIFPPAPPVPSSTFAKFALLRDNLSGRLGQIPF
ncbi:MAG TPA: peptidoglycan DD-metalloendopeptidase family protein [Acidobacteriota bacterium]|nr:peptidoglycan DD-metalloendopeptidase family protein [Acidobacteriota bacterium]